MGEEAGMRGAGQHETLIGIALMVSAVAGFASIERLGEVPERGTMSPMLIVAVRLPRQLRDRGSLPRRAARHRGLMRTRRPGLQVLRSLCLVTATMCSFVALRYLPLAQVTSITFASPLVVALIAGPLLGERVGWRRMVAVLVGFSACWWW